MIIHSKFKDYYDSALSLGHDTTVHYARVQEVTSTESKLLSASFKKLAAIRRADYEEHLFSRNMYIDYVLVGFCGKLYRLIGKENIYFSDVDMFKAKFPNIDDSIKANRSWLYSKNATYYPAKEMVGLIKETDEPFLEINAPIFLITRNELIVNPKLSEVDFYRVINPYECFQTVEQYLSNVLIEQKAAPEPIADKVKIASKGFDTTYGFRKRKGS